MSARPAAERRRIFCLAIALMAGASGCGKSSGRSPTAAGASDGGGTNGIGWEAAGGASSDATYAGVVLALVTERAANSTYVARALFTAGPRPSIGGCSRCCCASTDRGLPAPEKPPDAGTITLAAAGTSTLLATLVPEPFDDGSGTFYGMTDLGWSWFAPLGDYAPAPSRAWPPGDTLQVLATGNEVAPFSGNLRAAAALEGVTPPLGSTLIVDHTKPFEISWTPEEKSDATVLLGIPTGTGICYCDAPDSAGSLVVDASLLSPVSAELSLARLRVSHVESSNASIDLVGGVVERAPVEVQ
jgi:hypothetical protein